MEAAPRGDLNDDEILELEAYLSRRHARELRPVKEEDSDGKPADLTHSAPAAIDSPDVEPQRTLGEDGFRRTLLLTPDSDHRGPDQSMPLRIYHPFETETPPMLVRRRQRGLGREQGKHLEMTIGPDLDSWRAELHTTRPDGVVNEDPRADQGLELDGGPALRGHMTVLTYDPAVALSLAVVVLLLWVLWKWFS